VSLETFVGTEGGRTASSTSASGAMRGPQGMRHPLLRGPLFMSGTAAWRDFPEDSEYALAPLSQTNAGQETTEEDMDEEATRSAVMEVRRLSGLTWEQLARLFGVARRSLHFWASGKRLNAVNEERLRRLLAVLRKADRGFAVLNRAMLLEDRDGVIPLDLLVGGEYDAFLELVGAGSGRRKLKPAPLSPEARATRRPPPPDELVGALQDRVHFEKGRLISSSPIRRKREE
jgi:transcriptional regulator with XRE-family HTH domain